MARWLLETHSATEIHFFHSARNEENFIFREEILKLANTHTNFKLHCFLSQPLGKIPCHAGRLNAERLHSLLPATADTQAYLCGQNAYMADVSRWLREAGLPDTSIHQEDFAPIRHEISGTAERFNLHIPAFGKNAEIVVGELLLDVLEREGLPIIGACRTGVCGSCKCKVVDGIVETTSSAPLTPEELAAGYVLACSGTAKSHLALELA